MKTEKEIQSELHEKLKEQKRHPYNSDLNGFIVGLKWVLEDGKESPDF